MLNHWMRTLAAAGLGVATLAGGALAQVGGAQRADNADRERVVDGDLPGPIDSLKDFQDTGKMLFKLADTNNDNQISQKEAVDAGNLLVGGFFFRADQNGDGTLSREEAQQARDTLLQQKPFLRVVMRRAQAAANTTGVGQPGGGQPGGGQPGGTNPAQGIGALLDGNNDRELQAAELRQAVGTGVQGLYAAADTDRDGQLTPGEINAAIIGGAQAAAQATFQAADTDRNSALSMEEFNRAIVEPAGFVFSMIDVDGDNQISQQEAQAAQRLIMNQLQMLEVPEPANSPRNLIEQGRYQGAPIPNVGTPNPPSRTQPAPGRTAPAPAPAPVPR